MTTVESELPAPYREICGVLRESFELPSILNQIMKAAIRLAEADRGVFMLASDNQYEYSKPMLRAEGQMKPLYAFGTGAFVAYALACKALQEGQNISISDSSSQLFLDGDQWLKQYVPMSLQETLLKDARNKWFQAEILELEQDYPIAVLVIPLQLKQEPIGAIYLSRNKIRGGFTSFQIEQVETFIQLIANLLHWAILADNSQRLGQEHTLLVAHELVNPLASIKGYADLLLSDKSDLNPRFGPLTDLQTSFVETIINNVDRARSSIQSIVSLTKIEIGGLYAHISDVNMYEVIRSQVEFYQPKFASKKQKLNMELAGSSLHVLADKWKLEVVIGSMIKNAHYITPDGGEIKIQSSVDGNLGRFTIIDTGIGLTPDEKPHLFQKFYRSNRVKEIYNGHGLELFIAKHIIKYFGGQIGADGVVDQGSTFWFTVPMVNSTEKMYRPTDGLHSDNHKNSKSGPTSG
jgi:signal transduction histidine kinase